MPPKNKIFNILTLWGPGQPKRGTQTKKFQIIWFLVNMIYVEWIFEQSSLKNKIFKILAHRGPGHPKRGTQTKKFQLTWFLVYTIYVVWNFERSSWKNGDFNILVLRGPAGPNGAPKQKFFNWYDIRDLKATYWPNLKVLAWIMKKLVILTILGPPGKFFRGPKSKFCSQGIFGHG